MYRPPLSIDLYSAGVGITIQYFYLFYTVVDVII